MTLADHGRFPYSGVGDRPDFTWPGGRRLAVYLGLNLEHFAFGEGLGGQLAPGGPQPDVLNYAWREYGNRVGVWRMLDAFDALSMPVSLLVNSTIYDHCPGVVEAFRARGDEVVAHGRTNAERQGELDEAGESRLIAETTAAIRAHEGRAPRGWLGPWISQSRVTPDLLREQGYTYLLDWCHDDQPTWMSTRDGGRILAVPYPQEVNDIPAIMVRRASAEEFATMIVDNFDEMLEQTASASGGRTLVMGIALHAYLVGQPFRLRHLKRALAHIAAHRDDVWLTTSGAVAEHFAALPSAG
ncbi:MAG: polysaccharide deacetylase family protein [Ectothiorhodospiraceae bacterium]|nr:polysaccharide deacetylase family protein [Chromatiales bacterium]MCP5156974.1 polysaccharide deacetylase family protein [Ectothiorhodospiraceae bacterium]